MRGEREGGRVAASELEEREHSFIHGITVGVEKTSTLLPYLFLLYPNLP